MTDTPKLEPITYYTKCECCTNNIEHMLSTGFYTIDNLRKIIQGGLGRISNRYCEHCDMYTVHKCVAFKWPFEEGGL